MFSWLLKVMVRLVEVLGATWVIKGVLLWLTVSYMLTRRLQISMFWKHDLTLCRQRERRPGIEHQAIPSYGLSETDVAKWSYCAL